MSLSNEDRKLIEEEECLFQKIMASLFDQLPKVQTSKVLANQEARELTQRMTNEWNHEERQSIVSDEAVAHRVFDIRDSTDKALLKLIKEPYFGRVITHEDDGSQVSFLIGKRNNIEAGIVDWRKAPISSLYFNYQQGEEFYEVINQRERKGRIDIRRSYKVKEGRLAQIDTPEGVFQKIESGWVRLDPDKELVAQRSRDIYSREKKLPGILTLITKDQFEMITSDPDRPVIIQGSAGSGKTTVALHRLAWLLHPDNFQAHPENSLVLVMNKSLQIYIGSTLPSLGIDSVETSTFNGWALSIIRKALGERIEFKFIDLPSFIEEIKFSEEMLDALAGYVRKRRQRLGSLVTREIDRWPQLLSFWNVGREKPLMQRLKDFIDDIERNDLEENEKKPLLLFLNEQWEINRNHVSDLYDLLSDKSFLLTYFKSHPSLESHLEYLCRLTGKNRRKKQLDYFDMSLLLRLIQLKNGGLPHKQGEMVSLDHLVIDEAQDFGPVEYAILFDAVKDKRHLTIVGDVSQKIFYSRKFIGWEQISRKLEIDHEELIQLEVSHRCTAQIMTLARRVEGDPKVMEGRNGSQPQWYKAEHRDDFLGAVSDWTRRLMEQDPSRLIALICRYPKQAMELKEDLNRMTGVKIRLGHRNRFSFEPGIIATNVHQVKGLEFDAVALIEPNESNYPHLQRESRNMLYVAITRAQDDLLVIGQNPFSKILM
ncbi:MAG: UvrD-helicase domain-containing protein [Nitrospinota bacterium]|nr:UvrD-helicase domain-containing protein [Nitrospinota bacterium]